MKTIEVFVRSVYGVQAIYPANAEARTLAEIAGTKTIKGSVLAKAQGLGLAVKFVADPAAVKLAGAF